MKHVLFDSEIKVMELIWAHEPVSAKDVARIAGDTLGWNKNTTYTVIKKLESKGFVHRAEPGFVCTSLRSREEVCQSEIHSLVDRMFDGSRRAMFSAFLQDEALTEEDLAALRAMIDRR